MRECLTLPPILISEFFLYRTAQPFQELISLRGMAVNQAKEPLIYSVRNSLRS